MLLYFKKETMERDISQELVKWKLSKNRKPLIIRGARQIGKTWVVRELGNKHFEHFVEINFEQAPEFKSIFETLDPWNIIKLLSISIGETIKPGKSLLFFDEIQQCPKGITALRYFFEQMPELHVISAGSLLEFVLNSDTFSQPVGRVDYLFMHPLSFGEYLNARNKHDLRAFCRSLKLNTQVNSIIIKKLEGLLTDYCFVGGMPRPVSAMLETEDFEQVKREQLSIIQTYRNDFGKYKKRIPSELLEQVFQTTPGLVGQKYKYVTVAPNYRAETIRKALILLGKAGLVQQIFSTSAKGLPFSMHKKDNVFKVLYLDIGLMQRVLDVSKEIYQAKNLLSVFKGALMEQFIGQQLLTVHSWFEERKLYYWQREKPTSKAEVDYIWQNGSKIIPVEVKSGKTGTLKSLHLFLSENTSSFGVRFSHQALGFEKNLLSIPLWAVESFSKLIDEVD
jgi:uncharacterized protein